MYAAAPPQDLLFDELLYSVTEPRFTKYEQTRWPCVVTSREISVLFSHTRKLSGAEGRRPPPLLASLVNDAKY